MTRRRSGLLVAALTAGSFTFLAAPAHAQDADRDCADFSSQAAAQSYFESRGPGDPDRLDADNDGLACENLPAPSVAPSDQPQQREQAAPAEQPQPQQQPGNTEESAQRPEAAVPQGGVAAGGGGVADPSSPTLPAAGAVLGALLLGVGATAARRKATVS